MAGLLHNLMWNALEATLLALIVAAVAQLAKLRAPVRHVLWLMVLLKLLVPPVAVHSFGLSGICTSTVEQVRGYAAHGPQQTQVTVPDRLIPPDSFDEPVSDALSNSQDIFEAMIAVGPAEAADSQAIVQTDSWLTESQAETPAISQATFEDLPEIGSSDVSPADRTAIVAGSRWNWLTAVGFERGLIWFWFAGSLGLFAFRMRQCAALLTLVRRAAAAPASVVASCREVAQRFDLGRASAVRIVERSLSPTVCVLRRTTILLPAALVNRCGIHVVRSVLAHELAHVKRRDHWMCWVELFGSCVYWWHPVFWWARHELRRAADEAADALAVSVLGCRRQYAESLLQTVELLVADRAVAAAWCPALGQRDTIARRLTMIMKEPLSRRLSWPAWVGVAIVGLLALPAAPLRSSAQDPVKLPPPGGVPTDDEIAAAVDALDPGAPQRPREPGAEQPPSRDRRPDGPRPPDAGRRDPQPDQQPGGGDRRRDAQRPPEAGQRDSQRPQPNATPGRGDGQRDPERRLQELESKLDRIMQMLESRPGQPGAGAAAGGPPGAPAGFTPFSGMRSAGGPGVGFEAGQPPGAARGFGAGMSGARIGPGGGAGMSGGRPGQGPDGVEDMLRGDMLRGIELNPEQRERIANAHRELQVATQQLEAEQARAMEEFQRRRSELDRRRVEVVREALSPEQRERLQQRGLDAERPRERGEGRPEGREGTRPEGRGEGRGGPDRPRDATEPRRGPEGERPREGGVRRPERDRPREGGDRPRDGDRRPDGARPREGGDRPRDGERRPDGERPREGAAADQEVFDFFVGVFQ